MEILYLDAPPLPYYLISGPHSFSPGERHISRHHFKVFDLLFVHKGCLHMGEENREYTVQAGQALILRPDLHHYGSKPCEEHTLYHWLHFSTPGSWRSGEQTAAPESGSNDIWRRFTDFESHAFVLALPQYTTVQQPGRMSELLTQLSQLAPDLPFSASSLRRQMLFQEILLLLTHSLDRTSQSPMTVCAEKAASYLRTHYKEAVTAAMLGEATNFHPVYIARCMNREFGCSPMEYLLRHRIERSKLLLMQTDYSITRIAEETGFRQAPYFSTCFQRLEGQSPRSYRQQFRSMP